MKVCKGLIDNRKDEQEIVLVTKDLVLRLKAQIMGVKAEDFTTEQITEEDALYTGRCEAYIPEELVKEFKKKVVPLVYKKSKPYGVSPRNVGQYFMQEALMTSAEEAPLVIIRGMAGTAKTFYSLAVGMEKVYNNPKGEYRRIIVCRPNAQFDDDIGFLPGDEREKIAPLMRPIIDNLEQLLDSDDKSRYEDETELRDKIDEVFERGIIQTEALNFIRGRSIAQTYLIIDEAQNMTPNQVKGIIPVQEKIQRLFY